MGREVGRHAALHGSATMLQDGGFYYVIGYGQNLDVPTIDIISREISFIGNLVATYRPRGPHDAHRAGKGPPRDERVPARRDHDAIADLDEGRLHGGGILLPAGGG